MSDIWDWDATHCSFVLGFCIDIGFILVLVLGFPLGFIGFTRLNPNSNCYSNTNATFMRYYSTDK